MTVGGFSIPGLTSRQSETTVRLADGQSFAIAGLLSDRVRSNVQQDPVPGRPADPRRCCSGRSRYQRDESELLVVVTAHLARPVSPHDAPPLPTDNEQNDPNDIQLFLFGAMGGGGQASSQHGNAAVEASTRTRGDGPRVGAMMDRGPSGELGFIR